MRARERKKFDRLLRFGAALPRLRRAIAADLRAHGLPRDKVLATVVRVLGCANRFMIRWPRRIPSRNSRPSR